MKTDHYSVEMRAYLLGLLDEDRAATVEELYFTDRNVLMALKASEARLIGEYLAGELVPAELFAFEAKYLGDEVLRGRVEAARAAIAAAPAPIRLAAETDTTGESPFAFLRGFFVLNTRPVALAAALVLLLGSGWSLYRTARRVPSQVASGAPETVVRELRLNPGITMGDSNVYREIAVAPRETWRLLLNVPGGTANAAVEVHLSRTRDEGGFQELWSGPGKSDGTVATADIPNRHLYRGEYVVELRLNGTVREKYFFRVTAP